MEQTQEITDHRTRVGAERRQRMLAKLADAALRVMAEQGPERISVDSIIQAAGVARGTFYKYYDAPADLIRAVGAELAQDLIAVMAPALDGYDDPAQRLTVAFRSTLLLAKENPLLALFLIHAGWPVTDQVPAFSARAAANLGKGIEQGRFRKMPLNVALASLGGILIGTLAAMIPPEADPDIETEATITLLLAFGLNRDESEALAAMALEPLRFPERGLLSRAKIHGL
jgi:AcrR family transcriptional regulator